jgi:two-component system C4-dicarboxylate transport sensor histidine kinase DctB
LVEELRQRKNELEVAHAQLVHATKLAALGELSGSIAHELNQPLTVIRGLADLWKDDADGDGVRVSLEDVQLLATMSRRMARTVDGVRTFARKGNLQRRPIDASVPFDAALELMRSQLLTAGVELEVVAPKEAVHLHADAVRLEQVFVNMLANAADAISVPDRRDGRVRVRVQATDELVEWVFEDDGPGVPEALRERIFEPFFSTKESGRGLGLGLSISHGIVADHGGTIVCEEAEPHGARFVIRIPRRAEEE